MLQVTHAAADQLSEARRAQGLPETVGIRVMGQPQPGGDIALGLAFAEVPAEDDEVSEQHGTRLFVAPEVAAPLASAAIDIEQTPEGAKLILTPQDPGEES